MTDQPTTELSSTGTTGGPIDAVIGKLADLACADRELLRAEFDAIIAANFPDTAGRRQRIPPRPTAAVPTAFTRWPPNPSGAPDIPSWGDAGTVGRICARQRGPPSVTKRATVGNALTRPQEVISRHTSRSANQV